MNFHSTSVRDCKIDGCRFEYDTIGQYKCKYCGYVLYPIYNQQELENKKEEIDQMDLWRNPL